MKSLFILAGLGLAAASHAVLIDGFVDGFSDSGYVSAPPIYTSSVAATVPGGVRRVEYTRTSNPQGDDYRVRVNTSTGSFLVVNGVEVDGVVNLVYGSTMALNSNYSANPIFQVTVGANDQPNPLTITLASSSLGTVTRMLVAAPTQSPVVYSFDFSGAAQLADVDAITITSDFAPSGDFMFANIQAVPEPATMGALAIGLVAIARRRRR